MQQSKLAGGDCHGEVWVVLKTGKPRPGCGHSQRQLIAICEPVGGFSGEQMALGMCIDPDGQYTDHSFIIGPFPVNVLFPTIPVDEWPDSYRPAERYGPKRDVDDERPISNVLTE